MFFVDCYGPSALIMASLSNNAACVDESDEITLDSDPGVTFCYKIAIKSAVANFSCHSLGMF